MSVIRRVSVAVVSDEEKTCRLLSEVEKLSNGTKQERDIAATVKKITELVEKL